LWLMFIVSEKYFIEAMDIYFQVLSS
jgi:hypothetical protein